VQQLRDRIIALLGGQLNRRLILLVALVAVATIAILSSLNSSRPYKVVPTSAPIPSTGAIIAAKLYVHVVGEIEHPGVYVLDSGSRLYDAIFAAGGFSKRADQASVNLARELTDGEQIVISQLGESGATASNAPGVTEMISLNRASEAELESLPRVGPALAGRLIDWRQANGGFKSKQDLMKVAGIGPKLFASIEKLVTL
jgi:competence protein ComEA